MRNSILVVDDDDTIRLLITTVLEDAGYEVVTARNGLEALKAVDGNPFALVITDIMMPEVDGLQMAEGLRFNEKTRSMPIIFITASDDARHFTASVRVKARHFINKPFSNAKLLEKVKAVIGPPTTTR